MWAITAAAAAFGREACEPLDEGEFRDLLLQLRAGIDRGSEVLPTQVLEELDARIPCLTFVPEPRQWAELLVAEAVVSYAGGQPWEPAMSSALWIWPKVDRAVSARHPLAEWEPPEPPPPGAPLPKGARIWVDGLPSSTYPPAAGAHLVQRTDGRFWNSLVVVDEPLPEGWETDRAVAPPHLGSGAALDVLLAPVWVTQAPSGWRTDWVPVIAPGERTWVTAGVGAAGLLTFWSPFGVTARASAYAAEQSPGLDLYAAGVWTWRGLLVGAGGGTTSVDTFEGPLDAVDELEPVGSHTVHMLRYALGTVELRAGDRLRWHAVGVGGGSASCTRLRGELAVALPSERDTGGRWRLGVSAEHVRGRFEQLGEPTHRVDTTSGRVAIRVGRSWGEL